MKRKLLTLILLLSIILLGLTCIPVFATWQSAKISSYDPSELDWVSKFDSTYTQWNTTGSSPYLNYHAKGAAYIQISGPLNLYNDEGYFNFTNTSLTPITGCNLTFECKQTSSTYNTGSFNAYNQSGKQLSISSLQPTTTVYQNITVNIFQSSFGYNTQSKINSLKFYVELEYGGATTLHAAGINIDRCFLNVTGSGGNVGYTTTSTLSFSLSPHRSSQVALQPSSHLGFSLSSYSSITTALQSVTQLDFSLLLHGSLTEGLSPVAHLGFSLTSYGSLEEVLLTVDSLSFSLLPHAVQFVVEVSVSNLGFAFGQKSISNAAISTVTGLIFSFVGRAVTSVSTSTFSTLSFLSFPAQFRALSSDAVQTMSFLGFTFGAKLTAPLCAISTASSLIFSFIGMAFSSSSYVTVSTVTFIGFQVIIGSITTVAPSHLTAWAVAIMIVIFGMIFFVMFIHRRRPF